MAPTVLLDAPLINDVMLYCQHQWFYHIERKQQMQLSRCLSQVVHAGGCCSTWGARAKLHRLAN